MCGFLLRKRPRNFTKITIFNAFMSSAWIKRKLLIRRKVAELNVISSLRFGQGSDVRNLAYDFRFSTRSAQGDCAPKKENKTKQEIKKGHIFFTLFTLRTKTFELERRTRVVCKCCL